MDNITFVDRYTGDPRGRPTAFNACHECEAMGWDITREPQPNAEPDEDGYYWTHCQDCGGSGRVSVWRNLPRRLPRWLWKGVKFVWDVRMFNYPPPDGVSMAANMWMAFKCAFMVDLGLWSSETHRWKWQRRRAG